VGEPVIAGPAVRHRLEDAWVAREAPTPTADPASDSTPEALARVAAEQVALSWDAEYGRGRYAREEPVAFVEDILRCAAAADLPEGPGLYVGCGNGRNYLPLRAGGLDLIGLDVSGAALEQLAQRAPAGSADLVLGELSALPPQATFSIVIGIQVFQHGRRAEAHAQIEGAIRRVASGGLFCIRVNAVGTDVHHRHRVIEEDGQGGFTVEYLEGPKTGLDVHFFAEVELAGLLEPLQPVLALRREATDRKPPKRGRWLQWEGIYRAAH
jgi:Methyltransferase domain